MGLIINPQVEVFDQHLENKPNSPFKQKKPPVDETAVTVESGEIPFQIDSDLRKKSEGHIKNKDKIPSLNLGFVKAKNEKIKEIQ